MGDPVVIHLLSVAPNGRLSLFPILSVSTGQYPIILFSYIHQNNFMRRPSPCAICWLRRRCGGEVEKLHLAFFKSGLWDCVLAAWCPRKRTNKWLLVPDLGLIRDDMVNWNVLSWQQDSSLPTGILVSWWGWRWWGWRCLQLWVALSPSRLCSLKVNQGLPWWSSGKEPTCQLQGTWVLSLVQEDPTCWGSN